MLKYVSLVILISLHASTVLAVTEEATVGDVHARVYAPDWIWENQAVNILIIAENGGTAGVELTARLVLPENAGDALRYDGPAEQTVRIPGGRETRLAFTGLIPAAGYPLRAYPCRVELSDGGRTVPVACTFETIRGPAVTPGIWTALAPVGITLGWCLIFVRVLPPLARRGAWREPSPVFAEQEDAE